MPDQDDAWLEVRSCESMPSKELEHETVLRVPALKEVMQVAEGTLTDMQKKGGARYWDYSRRLDAQETEEVREAVFAGVDPADDGRAVSHSADVKYGGKYYTLTLVVTHK